MVKKWNILLLCAAVLFVFSGCEDFYNFNLFDGLDYVKMPTAEDFEQNSTDENLIELGELIASDTFIKTIAKDEDAQQVVSTYLQSVYNDPGAEEEDQVTAAVLDADLQLGVSGGDQLVDNVFGALQGLEDAGSGADSDATIQAILEGVMPDSITEESDPAVQEQMFTDMILGLLAVNDIYEDLGDSIISDPAAGNGDVTGGVLVNAAVAGMVTLIVESPLIETSDPTEAAGVLWDVYQTTVTGGDIADVDNFNESAEMTTSITDLTYLQNIATTAGVDMDALFGFGA